METTAPAIVTEVRDDLERIRADVNQLAHVDDVFWQVDAIIGAKESINKADIFQEWLDYCYAAAVAVGLRRLVATASTAPTTALGARLR